MAAIQTRSKAIHPAWQAKQSFWEINTPSLLLLLLAVSGSALCALHQIRIKQEAMIWGPVPVHCL